MYKCLVFLTLISIINGYSFITKISNGITVKDVEIFADQHLPLNKDKKKIIKSTIEHITIRNCTGSFGEKTFKHFPKLKQLTLWKTTIHEITSDLPITYFLSLRSQLPPFDQSLQSKLSKLETLTILGNHSNTIDPLIFKNFKHLKYLVISESIFTSADNCITKQWFKGMNLLEELSLSNNNLTCLTEDAFNNLKSLRHLDLTYNQLPNFERKLFKQLTKLEFLGFYDNNMDSIDITMLDSQKKHLVGLGVSWNVMKNANIKAEQLLKVLPKIKWISFGHNDMPKDFHAGEFCQVLRQNNVECTVDFKFGLTKVIEMLLKY